MPDWPHAPIHRLDSDGVYFVTAGTYEKDHFLRGRLGDFQELFFRLAKAHTVELRAWAFFTNHYHFIAAGSTLGEFIARLHALSALSLNKADRMPGRKIWFQFWDKQLTFQRSYLARLKYVHENAVHHQLVLQAENYRWCSAGWFREHAGSAMANAVRSFPIDRLRIPDDFAPLSECDA
jgi:putative transposase